MGWYKWLMLGLYGVCLLICLILAVSQADNTRIAYFGYVDLYICLNTFDAIFSTFVATTLIICVVKYVVTSKTARA